MSFKLRTEGSYLGAAWYLLNPLLMFLTLFFIFSKAYGTKIENYAFFLLLGVMQWNFLNIAVNASLGNILSHSNLIKSLNFRRESLVEASVLMALISHLFELAILFLFLGFFGLFNKNFIFFPLVLCFQLLFILGLCFAFSSLVLRFRDLDNVWKFASLLWFFATPIFYSLEKLEGLPKLINHANPMFYVIVISLNTQIVFRDLRPETTESNVESTPLS